MGVDYGIHLVHRFQERGDARRAAIRNWRRSSWSPPRSRFSATARSSRPAIRRCAPSASSRRSASSRSRRRRSSSCRRCSAYGEAGQETDERSRIRTGGHSGVQTKRPTIRGHRRATRDRPARPRRGRRIDRRDRRPGARGRRRRLEHGTNRGKGAAVRARLAARDRSRTCCCSTATCSTGPAKPPLISRRPPGPEQTWSSANDSSAGGHARLALPCESDRQPGIVVVRRQPVLDTQCGFRLAGSRRCGMPLRARGYDIETEMLVKLPRRRARGQRADLGRLRRRAQQAPSGTRHNSNLLPG